MPILVIGGSPEGDKKKPGSAFGGMQKYGDKPSMGEDMGDSSPDTQKQKEQAARIFFKAGQAGDWTKAASALETFITCCEDGEMSSGGDTEEEGD